MKSKKDLDSDFEEKYLKKIDFKFQILKKLPRTHYNLSFVTFHTFFVTMDAFLKVEYFHIIIFIFLQIVVNYKNKRHNEYSAFRTSMVPIFDKNKTFHTFFVVSKLVFFAYLSTLKLVTGNNLVDLKNGSRAGSKNEMCSSLMLYKQNNKEMKYS